MDESKETQMRDSPLPLSLSVVLDNIDTGIAIYDAKGNFVFINTVMVNWRNIPRNEYLTMNIHDFSNYLDICVFDLVMEKKQRVSRLQFYRDIQFISGPERMRIVTGTPIFDGKGNVQYVITMLQDVQKFRISTIPFCLSGRSFRPWSLGPAPRPCPSSGWWLKA